MALPPFDASSSSSSSALRSRAPLLHQSGEQLTMGGRLLRGEAGDAGDVLGESRRGEGCSSTKLLQ